MNRPFNPTAASKVPCAAIPVPCEAKGTGPLPKVACTECGGEGEDWWIALDSREYRLEDCPYCDGTGAVEARCLICEGTLSPEGFCADCHCSLTDFVVTVSEDGTARISC